MIFNYAKLRGRIKEKFNSQGSFAENLSISYASLSMKLNNKWQFSQDEIIECCEKLDIPLEELHLYFFTLEVKETGHG